jgi:hypothetical protein
MVGGCHGNDFIGHVSRGPEGLFTDDYVGRLSETRERFGQPETREGAGRV